MSTRPSRIRPPRVRQDENAHITTAALPAVVPSTKTVTRTHRDISSMVGSKSIPKRALDTSSSSSKIPSLKAPVSGTATTSEKSKSAKEQLLHRASSALADVTNGVQSIRLSPRRPLAHPPFRELKELKTRLEPKDLKELRRAVSMPIPSVPDSAADTTAHVAPESVRAETLAPMPTNRAPHTLARTASVLTATKRHAHANPPSVSTRLTSTRPDTAGIQKPTYAHRPPRVGHTSTNVSRPAMAQVQAQMKAQAVAQERTQPTTYPPLIPADMLASKAASSQKYRSQASATFQPSAPSARPPNAPKSIRTTTQTAIPRLQGRPIIPPAPLFDTSMEIISSRSELPNMDMDLVPLVDGVEIDPIFVAEYQEEIFAYKREMEIKRLPDPAYMDRQVELGWHCRARLMEWLVEVHDRFDLLQETIHLCVNYLDRFLSKINIPVDELQLAGTVALLLASKYEEIRSPAIAELSFLGGGAYPPTRIRQAEVGMLQALNYDMGAPGPMSFLRRISKVDDFDIDIRTLAKYLVDVTLFDHRFIGVPSSMIAAVGYRTSMLLLDRGEWTAQHERQSGYAEYTLSASINVLLIMLEKPKQTHEALFNKYKNIKFMESSIYVQSLGTTKLRSLHYNASF
ncbi:hypothetical protein FBU30_010051 [Linnemannia zychae]|nr:hypothetical protein FBU30_010051 [Linnemannia zychae]